MTRRPGLAHALAPAPPASPLVPGAAELARSVLSCTRMTPAKSVVSLCALVVAAAAACGMSHDASSSEPAGLPPATPGGGSAEQVGPSRADLGPTDNGVILVHAAGAPSFRLCFERFLDRLPAPDSELMPEANVVGVEVGSAVRIGPLPGPPGEVYLLAEPLIRYLYPPGQRGPSCKDLIQSLQGVYTPTRLGAISGDLSRGVHLLVVDGCASGAPATPAQCGATFNADAGTGNLAVHDLELRGSVRAPGQLPAQVIHLSQALESYRQGKSLEVSFGDIASTGPHTSVAANPTLGGPPVDFVGPPTFDDTDVGIYKRVGLTVSLGPSEAVTAQSLADIQLLSAPRDVPPSYYGAASNYVFLLLGTPNKGNGDAGAQDPRTRLHMLAVPVLSAKPDGGAVDAGSSSGDAG